MNTFSLHFLVVIACVSAHLTISPAQTVNKEKRKTESSHSRLIFQKSLTRFKQGFKTLGPLHLSLLTKLFPSTHIKLYTQGALNKNHNKTQPFDAQRGELKICLILYPVLFKVPCFLAGEISHDACSHLCFLV